MPDDRIPMRCPECGAAFDVPATWAQENATFGGIGCSHCLLERAKLVPLVKADEALEGKP